MTETATLTGETCPFLACVVRQPHTHPICPDCGAVRYGNIMCRTCVALRGGALNPHSLVLPEVS